MWASDFASWRDVKTTTKHKLQPLVSLTTGFELVGKEKYRKVQRDYHCIRTGETGRKESIAQASSLKMSQSWFLHTVFLLDLLCSPLFKTGSPQSQKSESETAQSVCGFETKSCKE